MLLKYLEGLCAHTQRKHTNGTNGGAYTFLCLPLAGTYPDTQADTGIQSFLYTHTHTST